jgi:cytidylate kinase
VRRRNLVVAIDGPSGAGKSTVARGVAEALGLRYLDTGAMYRAVTWLALNRGVDLSDAAALVELAEQAGLELDTDPAAPTVRADGIDHTAAVRLPEVTAAVSTVSAVPGVRLSMVARQRAIIGEGGIVVEGRDIGSTVAPDAPVKVFLVAAAEERAERRARQDGAADSDTLSWTEADLARRDLADSSRAASPLAQAPDAVLVDSTGIGADDVIRRVLALAEAVSLR